MAYIPRSIESEIKSRLFKRKAIVIYGPRQSGKTTLVKRITEEHLSDTLFLNADNADVQELFRDVTVARWRTILGRKSIVVIDEAQRIDGIGMAMKILIDELPKVQLIATGSSSFELADKTAEPLTGRKFEYQLLPLSFQELCTHHGLLEEKRNLENRLLYGAYPDIINHPGDERPRLSELSGSYLYKDLLRLDNISRPAVLDKLIRALAFQVGSEVIVSELAMMVGADNKTVERYLNFLQRAYVIFALPAFSRNQRNEIKKGRKFYFYDLGIRNAVIGNLLPITSRDDIGALWENYLILERLKNNINHPFPPMTYFWRSLTQKEVDYIEETAGSLCAWEFKWRSTKGKIPTSFINSYPEAQTAVITSHDYENFLFSE